MNLFSMGPFAQAQPQTAAETLDYQRILDSITHKEYVLQMDEKKWPNPFPKPYLVKALFMYRKWREQYLLHTYFNHYAELVKAVAREEARMDMANRENERRKQENKMYEQQALNFVNSCPVLDEKVVMQRYYADTSLRLASQRYRANQRTIRRTELRVKKRHEMIVASQTLSEDFLARINQIRDDKDIDLVFARAVERMVQHEPYLKHLMELEKNAEDVFSDYDVLTAEEDRDQQLDLDAAPRSDPMLEVIMQAIRQRVDSEARSASAPRVPVGVGGSPGLGGVAGSPGLGGVAVGSAAGVGLGLGLAVDMS